MSMARDIYERGCKCPETPCPFHPAPNRPFNGAMTPTEKELEQASLTRVNLYIYDWQTCLITTGEWKVMLDHRSAEGWRMVSASVSTVSGVPVAYVFWEKVGQ
jgi:hypothetical protein